MNRVVLRHWPVFICLTILSALTSGNTASAQSTEFIAMLSASNEVPSNPSIGSGMVTATLNGTTLTVSGTFTGLASDIATNPQGRAHIHTALAGQNGAVTFPLVPTINSDNRSGAFNPAGNTFQLTQDQVDRLMARGMYVNVHTVARPGGEIRGQLVPAGGTYFRANLSGRAEVAPGEKSRSEASGGAMLELRGDQLIVSGSFRNLESDIATSVGGGAHLHIGSADTSGPVAFALTVTPGEDARSGTFAAAANTFTLNGEQISALNAGRLYINVHSMNRMGGEIRGQIVPEETKIFEAYLSARNETGVVASGGSGGVIAVLHGSTLLVSGSFQGLSSPYLASGGAHLHLAAVGGNGSVIFPLTAVLDENRLGGKFKVEDNTVTLEPLEVEALLNGEIYANIHTDNYPSGELRGQLLVSTNLGPAASEIVTPTDGAMIMIPANLVGNLEAEWEVAVDPNNNTVDYVWEISDRADFSGFMTPIRFTGTTASVPFALMISLLDAAGIEIGTGLTLYHRVITSDGSLWSVSPTGTVTLMMEISGVEEVATSPFGDLKAYPNPLALETTIRFNLAEPSKVDLELFDQLGKSIRSIPMGSMEAGMEREVRLDATDLQSGVYTYRLTAATASGLHTVNGRIAVVK